MAENKLNPELKAKILAALRSGEYEQGKNALARIVNPDLNKVTYCCLGVVGKVVGVPDSLLIDKGYFTNTDRTPPEYPTCFIAGHDEEPKLEYPNNKNFDKGGLHSVMMYLNDVLNYTFPQIADWLEKQDI
jgi:hypothetical protein